MPISQLAKNISAIRGNRIIALGDSITASNSPANSHGGDSYFTQAMLLSSGQIRAVRNAGVSGDRTDQMLARIVSDVIAYKPDRCLILAGTNDYKQFVDPTIALANIRQMIRMLLANNIEPILSTMPPNDTVGLHPALATLNGYIKYEADKQGLFIVDFHNTLVDPATGSYKAGYGIDGTHPTPVLGHRAMATLLVSSVASYLSPSLTYLTDHLGDAANLITNGCFIGDANVDGISDSWGTLQGAGGTVTPTLVTGDAAIVGNWQQLAVTVAGDRWIQQQILTGWAPGDVLAFSGRWSATVQAGALLPAVSILEILATQNEGVAVYHPSNDMTNGIFYLEWQVPADTTTLYARVRTYGTGTGTVKVAQLTCLNLTALGRL